MLFERISGVSSEQPTQSEPGTQAPKSKPEEQQNNPFALFQRQPDVSYSTLLKEISSGSVKELVLVPARRQVIVTYRDGKQITVPVLANDQQILRVAEASGTPLNVKDVRQEQALAGLAGNLALIVLIVVGLSLLLRRSAQAANKAMGFGRTQARTSPQDEITVRFEDVAGIGEAKEELQEVVTFLKQPETFIKLGARIPRGVLLIGPPGTGKTLLAKAIAGEAGVPFFSIAASEFVEMFVGVGASRVRDLFKKAKDKAPCIVFIDEIDAVGRQRGAGIGGGNDEREQTLNQLLTEMDGFADNSGVILLAATNRPDVLDTALMRPGRFDRRIQVGLPDRPGRESILAVHARTRPLSDEVSLAEWASRTPGFSGADLANLLNEAAILTARHGASFLGNRELEEALERITMGLTAAPLQDGAKKRLKRPRTEGAARAIAQDVGKIVCGGKAARRSDGADRPQMPMRKQPKKTGSEKRLRALNKLLREIEALQERAMAGETLLPEQNAKCSRLDTVLSEMEALMAEAAAPPPPRPAGIVKPKKKEKKLPPWVKGGGKPKGGDKSRYVKVKK